MYINNLKIIEHNEIVKLFVWTIRDKKIRVENLTVKKLNQFEIDQRNKIWKFFFSFSPSPLHSTNKHTETFYRCNKYNWLIVLLILSFCTFGMFQHLTKINYGMNVEENLFEQLATAKSLQ